MSKATNKLYIITGEIQTGKTRWLQAKVKDLQKQGKVVAGVLAPGVWDENMKKQGIDNLLLPVNKLVHLAVRKPYKSSGYSKKWKFNDEVLAQVNEHFAKIHDFDVLVIDELGPLELEEGKGLTNAVKLLQQAPCKEAYVVIRPSLVKKAEALFSDWAIDRILI